MKAAPTMGLVAILAALAGAAPRVEPNPQLGSTRRLVTLRLHDDEDRTFMVSVAIGNAATTSRPGMPMLRLSPDVSPDGLLSLAALLVSTSSDPSSANGNASIVGPIALGGTARLELGNYLIDVTWVDDKTVADTATASEGGLSECCVVCDGIKTCGCRVQAPCGGCCDEVCGECGQTGSQTACGKPTGLEPPVGGVSPGHASRWRSAGTAKS